MKNGVTWFGGFGGPNGKSSVCFMSLSMYFFGPKPTLCASVGALTTNRTRVPTFTVVRLGTKSSTVVLPPRRVRLGLGPRRHRFGRLDGRALGLHGDRHLHLRMNDAEKLEVPHL